MYQPVAHELISKSSFILALSFLTVELQPLASFCLGISLAFGLFTRITFVLFGAPVGCAYLYMAWKRASGARLVFLISSHC
jgi:hypothetical protein